MENSQEMHFYESRVRNVLLFVGSLIFLLLGVLVSGVGFNEGDYVFGVLGIFISVIFILCLFLVARKFGNTNSYPYLTLTEEYLIINVTAMDQFQIKWDDIEAFDVYKMNNNKFIGIILNDEDKYSKLMSNKMRKLYQMNTKMNLPLFNIVWGQIKRQDREQLLEELDYRTFGEQQSVEN
ncbi:STM3941 family protein [Tenuibacillus multivorans]|uniref:Uncharacterized protein n=1 Tax=Tenuibacillus multivorans TaxID=237069 RepID=A0A1G9YJI5_9BACI|nr:STM3941 family protein [Tenuibacillus multivorans]GEL78442.1 hypothetical protein TMU01_26770 [Tenuibacillus multivorans]SDN09389.1 hypothetical protein SAMN05216498_1444 [Tenuibacillus multivorans]